MESILSYESDSDENSNDSEDVKPPSSDLTCHLKPVDKTNSISNQIALNSAPIVVSTVKIQMHSVISVLILWEGYHKD